MNEELNEVPESISINEAEQIKDELPIEELPKDIEQPVKRNNFNKWIFPLISILSLVGVAILFVLYFNDNKKPIITPPKTIDKITYAFVNTDTIMEHYDFVLDVQVDLKKYEQILQNQFTNTASTFKKEYEDYIKRASAGLLTLEQQKKTEENLADRQQGIAEMEQSLAMQLQQEKLKRNMEVTDTIINYIKRYNLSKDYTFIFEQTYGSGLLYANPALDITSEILKGLNEEYAELLKKKKSESKEEKRDK